MTYPNTGFGRTLRWMAFAAIVAVPLAACGDDGSAPAAARASTGAVSPTTASQPAALVEFCQLDVDFDAAFGQFPFPQGDPTAADTAAIKAYAGKVFLPLVDRAEKLTIDPITPQLHTVTSKFRDLANNGDLSFFFQDQEWSKANALVTDFSYNRCPGSKFEVQAADYSFAGIPASVPAGVVRFKLVNGGKEVHHMIVMRKNDGVTDSFDDILMLDQKAAEAKVSEVGEVGATPPGGTEYATMDVKPGQYVAVCFISVGTTDPQHEGDGPPHMTKGMKTEFTVS